jgi:hypothetical protein
MFNRTKREHSDAGTVKLKQCLECALWSGQ